MIKVRVVKTASSAQAVQAVSYQNNKRVVLKHFGSCHTHSQLDDLIFVANEWIKNYVGQISIFPQENPNVILKVEQCSFLGVYYTYLYDFIYAIQTKVGFTALKHPLLNDLVVMRIMEPASKLRSIELMEIYFGIQHQRKNYYKIASQWLLLKEAIEAKAVAFARQHYAFNFELLFYDVTTLYFETFTEDELRKNGFSKDNKSQQPQILVALMVTQQGFPIAYEIFPGNTFEGHTILPAVNAFINKHTIKHFTIVADAAMISTANIEELKQNNINYIVGARLGNISNELFEQIDSKIIRQDGKLIRLQTDNGYLVCSYSSTRYRKDKYEMEKQIVKAKQIIAQPSKNKKVKFTKTSGGQIGLNKALIDKTTKLLGIKGYYTNLEEAVVGNQTIIERYCELYKIEQAFRVAKHDLQTRPIFHFKEDPIKLHTLICFMALAISKHIELATGESIRSFLTECKKIADARILNHITGKEIILRTELTPEVLYYQKKLNVPH